MGGLNLFLLFLAALLTARFLDLVTSDRSAKLLVYAVGAVICLVIALAVVTVTV